jgi:hypothetical protein
MKKIIIITTIFLSASFIKAQTCCTAGTPLLGSLEHTSTQKGILNVSATYDFNNLTDVYEGSSALDDNSRKRISQSFLLNADYGLTDNISVSLLLSYINQIREIDAGSGSTNRVSVSGIGDAIFLAKYQMLSMDIVSQRELAFGAGVKIPTGNSNIKSNGILLPADMQPGTGSYDGIFWAHFTQGSLFNANSNLFINLSYRLNSSNDRFGPNNGGYKFGNEFITDIGLGYRTDHFVDFTLAFKYRNLGRDEFTGSEIPNTGGDWYYLSPGINFKLSDKLTIRTNGELPVYRDLNGTQLTTTYKASVSLHYSFIISNQIN